MSKRKLLLLLTLAAAQFMVVLDGSIVNVALSHIMRGLNFSPESLQWVVTAYTITLGGFLLLGGRTSDLFGRRKIFLAGLIGFTISSLLAGMAQNELWIIVARAIQGLAAAFMSPVALSIVLSEFHEGRQRNIALGVWGAVASCGAAAGLILGGIITERLGWRWDFIVNVPIGFILTICTIKFVPTHHADENDSKIDFIGSILVTLGLMSFVYGITNAPEWGWLSTPTLCWLIASLVLLSAFIVNESRTKNPLLDLTIFKNRNLTVANIVQLFMTAGMMSMFYFLSLYIQTVEQYDPLKTGLAFLPFAVIAGITSTILSKRIGRLGFKKFLVVGPILQGVGLIILSQITTESSCLSIILPGISIMAFGAGMSFILINIAATAHVTKEEAGLVSGLINTSQQIGGALGLAILSGLAMTTTASLANPNSLQSIVSGYSAALTLASIFAITGGIVSFLAIKRK